MSVEIRRGTEGFCECPGPHPADYEWGCRHWWECDWGILDNTEADPKRGLHHLMLTTRGYATQLLEDGPRMLRGNLASVTVDGGRSFMHLDHAGGRATWELFDAHLADGKGIQDLVIGRWPD